MPLTCARLPVNAEHVGYKWTVSDEPLLVRVVGQLLLGRSNHVARILRGQDPDDPVYQAAARRELLRFLRRPRPDTPLAYHRDGLLFQLLSWVAAYRLYGTDSLLRPPHSRPADKGIDNLIVTFESQGANMDPTKPVSMTVCEDKATESPRKTVREDVWPSLKEFEEGLRDPQLTQDVTLLLGQIPEDERDAVTDALFSQPRRYRVSLVLDAEPTDTLFSGYEGVVIGGDVDRRRGEHLLTPVPMREWMAGFSEKVAVYLETLP